MSDDRLIYFVRKAQLVSCENMARRATIQRESVVNGNGVTDLASLLSPRLILRM